MHVLPTSACTPPRTEPNPWHVVHVHMMHASLKVQHTNFFLTCYMKKRGITRLSPSREKARYKWPLALAHEFKTRRAVLCGPWGHVSQIHRATERKAQRLPRASRRRHTSKGRTCDDETLHASHPPQVSVERLHGSTSLSEAERHGNERTCSRM